MSDTMKIKAIAQWFGSNRKLGAEVGKQLGKLEWCGVPCVGGASELRHIKTRGGVANDLHSHVVNLARCIADPILKDELIARLDGTIFHPIEMADAQARCLKQQPQASTLFGGNQDKATSGPDVSWAADYFCCSWMGRGGLSGTKGEFRQSLGIRWSASGGASSRRFRSVIESLGAWHQALKAWEFSQIDAIDFMRKCKDIKGHGVYIDAPWPEDGDGYAIGFDEAKQRKLAIEASLFVDTRVVIRYGDHPLIRELYPTDSWTWIEQESKDMHGGKVPEVLIINGPSYGGTQ